MDGHRGEYCLIPVLFVVPDRVVVVVVDDALVCDVGAGEDDLVVVVNPLPVPTIVTGFSLVDRAKNEQKTLSIFSFDHGHTC